jgi:hypothetical protein
MLITTIRGDTWFTVKIKNNFKPVYTPALIWAQASSGNWNATDRGASVDYYDAENVRLYGNESGINTFIAYVETNRKAPTSDPLPNELILSNFNETEKIFGADIDYSTELYTTIPIIDRRIQGSWKGFGVACKMRLLPTFSFVGSAVLPTLRHLAVGYDADADRTINKLDSYDNTFFYQDHRSDEGIFSGYFIFTDSEMADLRQFHATQRGSAFSLTGISGVAYPFGKNRYDIHGNYPYTVKLLKIEDEQVWSVGRWKCKLTIAEVV